MCRVFFLLALGAVVALDKPIISWPVSGGLDSKTGPLSQQPGTFLTLDNVRQERRDEWRNRQAIVHLDSNDDTALAPLRYAELPGGGLVALSGKTAATAGLVWNRGLAGNRWQSFGSAGNTLGLSSQLQPGAWRRSTWASEGEALTQYSLAIGNGFRLRSYQTSAGLRTSVVSDADGNAATYSGTLGSAGTSKYPKCVFDPSTNRFLLLWVDGTNLIAEQWNALTGAIIGGGTLKTNVNATSQWLDALFYGNNHVTVVYRNNLGNAHFLEVDASTLALGTDVDLANNCDNALALLPDPDASGLRFVAIGTGAGGGNAGRVMRVTTAGAISTNDAFVGGRTIHNIIGCAYQAGASWMVAFTDVFTSAINAVKKYNGVIGGVKLLTPGNQTAYWLDSNAWREPGTDPMRFMCGIHIGGTGTAPTSDFQNTYFEMALEYDTGNTTIAFNYTEPQARLLPLNAGLPLKQNGSLPQVTRTAANSFALPLGRIARDTLVAGVVANQYSVDQWNVSYLTTSSAAAWPNLGPGVTGVQAAYIPAGQLLQSVNGQSLWALGASAIPFKPAASPTAGSGLTAGLAYQWMVTDERLDEAGNVWRSQHSLVSNTLTPSGGNLAATVLVTLATFENQSRYRTVKTWRTLGDGTTFYLLDQRSIPCDIAHASFTITDTTTDATLVFSDPFTSDLETTITPAISHACFFDGRMFGSDRDYPSRVYYTHVIANGESPSFTAEFTIDGIEDEFGDVTGMGVIGDRLVIFKDTAIYLCVAGGPDRAGNGRRYQADRIVTDQGAVRGTPLISMGDEIFFIGHFGVYAINKAFEIRFVGEPIDRWFNQDMILTPEVPIAFTKNPERNEIRLLTANYRFVYDTIHGQWMRDTQGASANIGMFHVSGVGDMFFRANGQVWWDYDAESTSYNVDASGSYTGIMRSAWIRPANTEGYLMFYRMRSIFVREPAGVPSAWPTQTVYFDNHDSVSESSTPAPPINLFVQMFDFKTRKNKCSTFSLQITLPAGDITWRVDKWAAQIAIKASMRKAGKAEMGRT